MLVSLSSTKQKLVTWLSAFSLEIVDETESISAAATAAKSLQSCPTLCDPRDGSPPGSPIPGILRARTLGWVAISFLQCMKVKSESEVTQSCPTLSDPMDCSPPGSPVRGILQARVLEWGATAFSKSISMYTQWSTVHLSLEEGMNSDMLSNFLPPVSSFVIAGVCWPMLHHVDPWWRDEGKCVGKEWTAAYQASPSLGFSRQEYWSGVPLPSLRQSIKDYN